MILRLTPKTAELIDESPGEWELLEKPVRAGLRTTGNRAGRHGSGSLRRSSECPCGREV